MTTSHRRVLGAGIAATALAALVAGTPAVAGAQPAAKGNPNLHDRPAAVVQRLPRPPRGHRRRRCRRRSTRRRPRSGAPSTSSTKLTELRAKAGDALSLTVAAGDLIGGSTFLSGHLPRRAVRRVAQRDGPRRQQRGQPRVRRGHHRAAAHAGRRLPPGDGCYFPDQPYAGADFPWLAANVVKKDAGEHPAARHLGQEDQRHQGRLHRHDARGHPDPGQPRRCRHGRLQGRGRDRQRRRPRSSKKQGVKAIVVLLHEGGYNAGTYNAVRGHLRPDRARSPRSSAPRSTQIITGHTHQPVHLLDPRPGRQPAPGHERRVVRARSSPRPTSSSTRAPVRSTAAAPRRRTTSCPRRSPRTRRRPRSSTSGTPSPGRSGPAVVGTHAEDITGDSSGNRGIETPMADLVADAILWGTTARPTVAPRSRFMNVGGVAGQPAQRPEVRASSRGRSPTPRPSTSRRSATCSSRWTSPGSPDQGGARAAVPAGRRARSRPMLALGVSEGFTYTWDATQPAGLARRRRLDEAQRRRHRA